MNKHSHGEWYIGHRLRSDGKRVANCIIAENGQPICEGFEWNSNGENDSHLIAAAPRLLEALERLRKAEHAPRQEWIDALTLADKAIAKAKGETL